MNQKREAKFPFVLWFTGLSGSGKSTLAAQIGEGLNAVGYKVERLDGDGVRAMFPQTGFSREERDQHIRRIGYISHLLEKNGIIVIASFISPYREARDSVRNLCHRFIEVYLSTPLAECERRDVKGLYGKARRGEIPQFTGVNDPYEPPAHPELTIDTSFITENQALEILKTYIKGLL